MHNSRRNMQPRKCKVQIPSKKRSARSLRDVLDNVASRRRLDAVDVEGLMSDVSEHVYSDLYSAL